MRLWHTARAPIAAIEALRVFLGLSLRSFGGPIAHIAYFHEAFVSRRGGVDGDTFAHLIAIAQLLPGPASSQVGMAIGLLRAGPLGAFCAWLGFTLPSATAMLLLGLGVARLDPGGPRPCLRWL